MLLNVRLRGPLLAVSPPGHDVSFCRLTALQKSLVSCSNGYARYMYSTLVYSLLVCEMARISELQDGAARLLLGSIE